MKRLALVIGLLLWLIGPAFAGTLLLMGAGGTGAPATPPTTSFIGIGTLTAAASTFTKTGASIGTASASRLVVVVTGGIIASGRTIVSATIGGVAATVHITKVANTSNYGAIFSAVVPTGTTGDIVVVMSSTIFANWAYAVYTIDSSLLSSLTPVTDSGAVTAGTTVSGTGMAASASGIIIAGTLYGNGGGKSPNSMSDDKGDTFTQDIASASVSTLLPVHANAIAGGTTIVTATWTNSFDGALVATAWR